MFLVRTSAYIYDTVITMYFSKDIWRKEEQLLGSATLIDPQLKWEVWADTTVEYVHPFCDTSSYTIVSWYRVQVSWAAVPISCTVCTELRFILVQFCCLMTSQEQTNLTCHLPQINNSTDAGLHVVIELVGEHIYTISLGVCVFMYARLLRPVLQQFFPPDNNVSYLISMA